MHRRIAVLQTAALLLGYAAFNFFNIEIKGKSALGNLPATGASGRRDLHCAAPLLKISENGIEQIPQCPIAEQSKAKVHWAICPRPVQAGGGI